MWLTTLLAVGLFGAPARAADAPTLRVPGTYSAPWHALPGDDPRFADPTWDASAWPLAPRSFWGRDPGFGRAAVVWYRTEARVLPLTDQQVAVSPTGFGALEVYVNGVLVGRSGRVGERMEATTYPVFPIPPEALRADGRMTLAVRAWAPWTWHKLGGDLKRVMIGDRPTLELWADNSRLNQRASRTLQLVEGGLGVLIGTAHLALFRRRRQLVAHLWFGLASAAIGAESLLFYAVWVSFVPFFPFFSVLQSVVSGLGYALLVKFAQVFFGYGARVALPLGVTLVVTNILQGLRGDADLVNALLVWVGLAPSMVFLGLALRHGLRTHVTGARFVAAGSLCAVLWPVAQGLAAAGPLHDVMVPWMNTVRAFAMLGLTAGMVLGLAEQFASNIEDLEATYRASRWFVPTEFLRRLGRASIRDVRRGDTTRIEMTVMFLDIRGFTTFAEAHTPDEAFTLINELLDLFEPHVHRHGGFITQFTGDGFLALFESPDGAVQAAIDQQRAVDRFRSPVSGDVPLRVGIGLHTGSLMLGTVGGKEQLMAGVVADTANLASRIEAMTKTYGARVLCSDVTRARLADAGRFQLREVDRVVARGRREQVGVVEVLDAEADSVRDARRAPAFLDGYAAYRSGEFGLALAAFSVCLADTAAEVLAARCRALVSEPPTNWDGVWRN